MWIGVVTLFPHMFEALRCGITGRALKQAVHLQLWNPRDFSEDPHGRVDDRPFGGGPGMVMQVGPLRAAIRAARAEAPCDPCVIYVSPQGRPFTQALAREAVAPVKERLRAYIFVAGRYEGIDQRVIDRDIDAQWSLGDFVLSGGELAIMAMIDAMVRLLPGSLGNADSGKQESFTSGVLGPPQYTRPACVDGDSAPAVLLSGNHDAIARWRMKQALGRTWLNRPDLLAQPLTRACQQGLLDFLYDREET